MTGPGYGDARPGPPSVEDQLKAAIRAGHIACAKHDRTAHHAKRSRHCAGRDPNTGAHHQWCIHTWAVRAIYALSRGEEI